MVIEVEKNIIVSQQASIAQRVLVKIKAINGSKKKTHQKVSNGGS